MQQNDDTFTRKFLKQNSTILFGEYVKRLDAIKSVKTKMSTSDTYINWLINFTLEQDNKEFYDNDWLYKENQISKENLSNVKNLTSFFDCIYDYLSINASRTYFNKVCSSNYFDVIFKGTCIRVGHENGQGTQFYSKIMSFDENITYIDFEKILKGDKFNASIEDDIEEFRKVMLEAYVNGLSEDEIRAIIKTTLEYVKDENTKDPQRIRKENKKQA